MKNYAKKLYELSNKSIKTNKEKIESEAHKKVKRMLKDAATKGYKKIGIPIIEGRFLPTEEIRYIYHFYEYKNYGFKIEIVEYRSSFNSTYIFLEHNSIYNEMLNWIGRPNISYIIILSFDFNEITPLKYLNNEIVNVIHDWQLIEKIK